MSADWIDMELGEFAELKRGYDLPKREREIGIIPLVSSSGTTDLHSVAKVKGPGVITGRYGTIGLVFYVEEDFWPLNTTLYVQNFKNNNPLFVYYLLKTISYEDYSDKAAVPGINRNHLHKAKIRVPVNPSHQQEIAEKLWVLDSKIELNRQTNQTLEQIAQAIFKSWFVDFEPTRAKIIAKAQGADPATQELAAQAIICGAITLEQLQGYVEESVEESAQQREQESLSTRLQKAINEKLSQASVNPLNTTTEQLIATAALFPNALVESELGEVPEDWEVKALDEIAHYQNGLALQKFRPENDEESLPVLKIAQLRKGFADGEERASANIKSKCIVDDGDVIFSWSGSLIVDVWSGGKVALNQHLFKVTSLEYPKWFYYYWTKYHLEAFQQIAADKAVTMGHIKREHLSQAKCLVPADNLLELGGISNLLEKQVLLNLENFSLENIRDALLPKLLSGELDVSALADNPEKQA